jgi:hypothetical protein
VPNAYIYAFDKLDGSNIRAEWHKKKGFWKFGTKTRLVDASDPIFGQTPELIRSKYEQALSDIFKKEHQESTICFFEFFGASSQFGVHVNEPHDVVLIDVNLYKKGIMSPKDFLKLFGSLHIPNVVYSGYAHHGFVEGVRNGTLPGITFEGVVCKTGQLNPDMFKVKTNAWMEKLRTHCHGDEEMFRRLA